MHAQLLGYSRCVLHEAAAWSTADTVKIIGSEANTAAADEYGDNSGSTGAWEFSEIAMRLGEFLYTLIGQLCSRVYIRVKVRYGAEIICATRVCTCVT